jgi:hypothetical protein
MANDGGKLTALSFSEGGGSTVPAGDQEFVTLHMRARDTDGTSDIRLSALDITDREGNSISGTVTSASVGGPDTGSGGNVPGRVIVGTGSSGAGGLPWMLIMGIIAGVVAVGGTGIAYVRRRQAWE